MWLFSIQIFLLVFQGVAPAGAAVNSAYEKNAPVPPDDIPPQVWSVDIEGNESFDDVVIKSQIATEAPAFLEKVKFWNKQGHALERIKLEKDAVRIRNFYRRRGYPHVKVSYRVEDDNKPWKKHIVFIVDENTPILIKEVGYSFISNSTFADEIKQSRSFREAQKGHAYQPGRRYETIRKPQVAGTFVELLENLGFAYSNVNVEAVVDTTALQARVQIELDTGPRTYIDSIRVEGIMRIDREYAVRESGLKQGTLFSKKKVEEAQQELFNHHLIRFVTVSIPEQVKDSTLTLLMRVRENEPRSVQASVGFGTEEYLRGQMGWTHRNAFGRGHRFTANARASFIEQAVNMDYLFPYIFNTKSSVVIAPFGQHLLEKSFELLRGGITNSFIYRYSENITGSASYQFTRNKELSKQLDASLPDTTLQYNLSSLQFTGYYSEGFSREQRGWVIQPYAEFSGFFGNATFSFQKLSIDVRRYFQLSNTTKLALRVQSGSIFNAKADSLPNNLRFFLGGTNSVRGWNRHELGPKQARVETDSVQLSDGSFQDTTKFVRYIPVGGKSMFSFNVEVRQELNGLVKGLGMAAFLDGGQVWEDVNSVDRRTLQFGVGGGFRYRSPIGPLRIDIGYKINPTKKDLDIYKGRDFGNPWNRLAIHFSIGQAF